MSSDGPRYEWRAIPRALSYLKPYRLRFLLTLVCVAVSSALGLVPALVLRKIVNELTRASPSFESIATSVVLAIAALLLASLCGVLQTYLTLTVSEDVVARVRSELFDHLMSQSIGYFTAQRGGAAISHVLNDAGGIDNTIGPALSGLASSAVMGVVALAVMFYFSLPLTLCALCLGPIVAVLLRIGARALYRARDRVQSLFSELTIHLHDTLGLSGILLVKAFARIDLERRRFAVLNRSLRDAEVHAGVTSAWFGVTFSLLQALAPAVLVVVGSYLVIHHDIGLGTLMAFALVAARFAGSVQAAANATLMLLGSLALWRRIFDVLDRKPELQESPQARTIPQSTGRVSFEDVRFRYAGQPRWALDGVSAELAPRSLTALVGESGAGKTTLSQLVPRFYDPQEGRVLIDGIDVRDLSFRSIGDSVAMVLQDTYLVHASLRDNLRYGRPNASDAEILACADLAHLGDLISLLPNGLDTVVGERGHRLSGGEKQRVAIARALLKDPPILILDEATAHLDSISEKLVQTAMRKLMGGRTSLVIAHRLSTVLDADQILVLDRGVVVERGSHVELRLKGGIYSHLYETQFGQTYDHQELR